MTKKIIILVFAFFMIGCSSQDDKYKALECRFEDENLIGNAYLIINDEESTFDAYYVAEGVPGGPNNIMASGSVDESDKITTLYANAGGEMYIDRITLRVTSLASDEILLCNVIDVPEDYLASISEEVRF